MSSICSVLYIAAVPIPPGWSQELDVKIEVAERRVVMNRTRTYMVKPTDDFRPMAFIARAWEFDETHAFDGDNPL